MDLGSVRGVTGLGENNTVAKKPLMNGKNSSGVSP